jgi:heat shock protein HslJ
MKDKLTFHKSQYSRFLIGSLVLVLLIILMAACGGEGPPPISTPQLPQETEQVVEAAPTEIPPTVVPVVDPDQVTAELWLLVGFGDAANPAVVDPDTLITLEFAPDGTVSGSSGCNNYSSSYELEADGSLTISTPFAATMMMCPKGMDQESAYLGALETATSLRITDEGWLEILFDSGQPYEEALVYVPGETPLVGTQWLLLAFGDADSPSTVEEGTIVTAVFTEEGNVSGSGGCNYYAGSYEVSDDQISFGPLATTAKICPVGSEQETEYLSALDAAETFNLFGQRLSISYNDGQGILVYTSANLPLEGTLWTLVSVESEPLAEGLEITALFKAGEDDEQNTVAGSAGCNNYTASFEVDGENLNIGQAAATRKFCETGMDEEAEYLDAIEGENTYRIIGDNLDLVTESGTLSFVADRTPLTGALWELVALGDVDEPQEPVAGSNFTAQFSRNPNVPSGVVTGTTGCNEYAAAYVASQDEIKINLPEKTRNEDCVPGLMEQEQQYFLALNNAATYHILGNVLFIPYDEGRQALVFSATQTQLVGFRPLSDLDGMQWFLHFIHGAPILPGTLIDARIKINPDGQGGWMAGSAGCNTYNATFGEGLGAQTAITSSGTCFSPEGIMDQEISYLNSLSRAYGYWFTGNQLVVNTGSGALTYRQNPPESAQDQTHLLQNVKWYLVNYNDKSSLVGTGEPFIFFNLDNTFSGFTGCNEMGGEYATQLDSITFLDIAAGSLPCPDETSTKQQQVILANLQNAETFVVADTGMQIASDRGVLYYSSVPVQRPEPSEPPAAVITGPSEAMVGEINRFDGSTSTSEIGISGYSWDYGDGTTGAGPVVEKVYTDPGTYQVALTVTDKLGQSGSAMHEITITAQPPEQIPPTAAIEGPSEGFVAEPVTFSAEGSISGSSPIASFSWDYGDGSSSPSSPNSTVTTLYENPGTFTVTVTATDANGLSDSASMEIVIDTRLEGPVWSLYPVLPRSAITLQFLQGELAGFSGCNTYTGTYSAVQNEDGTYQVEVQDLITTRLSCVEEIMDQEDEYITALNAVNTASIEGNLLMLSGVDSELVYYEVGTLKPEQLPALLPEQ